MKINYWQKFEELGVYHLYNRGNNREKIFLSNKNYFYFMRQWKKYLDPYLEILAYCLMPNHFHFIVRVKEFGSQTYQMAKKENTRKSMLFLNNEINNNDFLEDQFKRYFSSYSLSINKQYDRTGSLFQKRFKRVQIETEIQLIRRICYVHHNPIHHRYSINYENWKYSSYLQYQSQKSRWLKPHFVYSLFHPSDKIFALKEFLRVHNEYLKEQQIILRVFPM